MVAYIARRGALVGLAPVLLSAACALNTMPRAGLAEQQGLTVVGSELRIRVRALASPHVAAIEEAADDAARRCPAPAIRARALEWKLAAIPQAQDALLRTDPLVALLDGWAYAVQMQRNLESPADPAGLVGTVVETLDDLTFRIAARTAMRSARNAASRPSTEWRASRSRARNARP